MSKIAFHTDIIDVRGTCVAVYDYAHYNEVLLDNISVITVPYSSILDGKNDDLAVKKFMSRFQVYFYNNLEDLENFISDCKIFYVIKYGKNDNFFSTTIKTCIHCVFDMSEPHGDVYAGVSKALVEKYGTTLYVPHMISLSPSKTNNNLRQKFAIPSNAVVFSRYGGFDTFNLPFCYDVIRKIVIDTDDRFFLFINTPCFYVHPKIIHLDKVITDDEKNEFICTSDAHLECSSLGHTFGLSIGEYSVNNKPVICYNGWTWNTNHLQILGEKAITFKDEEEFYNILLNFNPDKYINQDNNCYKDYTPENVMNKFKQIFLD